MRIKPGLRRGPLLVLFTAIALHAGQCLGVSTIIDSLGFESPDYALGDLTGQPGFPSWLYNGSGLSTATVQTDVVASGSQAVEVHRAAGDDSRWAIPVVGYPTTDVVLVEWDMNVQNPGIVPSGGGPFLGVEVYGSDGSGSAFGAIGSVGVDTATGQVLYLEKDTAELADTGVTAPYNGWLHYAMTIDFSNKLYQVHVEGVQVAHEAFIDDFVVDFSDADLTAVATDTPDAVGTAYFDNFTVVEFERLAGDYNTDGTVDQDDFDLWLESYGATVATAGSGADGNSDGMVGSEDYAVWRENLGAVAGASSATLAPEPGVAALLLMLGGAGLLRRA